MDYKQLLKDIGTLNFTSFGTRYHKLIAVLRRKFLLSENNFAATGNFYEVPIIINNRNRLDFLKKMIGWLRDVGYKNIVILDNMSNYEPLLEYYQTAPVKVIALKENLGHLAFWKSGVYRQFYKDYYVYTDPDLVPVEECPKDFMNYFFELLNKYNDVEKVGFGLKIDDLPDHYDRKKEVIEWEKKFWTTQREPGVYDAALDTTFALYRPYTNGAIWVQNALRTGRPYLMRHLPWYENTSALSAESLFYKENMKKGASHWIIKDDK